MRSMDEYHWAQDKIDDLFSGGRKQREQQACERLHAILIECDEVGKIDGVGLCDAIDNDGDPYQSQHLADVLAGILAGEVKP